MEKILNEAMLKGVNDIYISPTKEEKYVIKFHVNGKLKISKYVEY